MSTTKIYLGDALYAEIDGNIILLTTETEGIATNKIYLEPEVQQALWDYIEWLKHHKQQGDESRPE
jgi:hypothetical protein